MQTVIEKDPNWAYEFFQSYYIAPNRTGLLPDRTFIHQNHAGEMEVFFETNAWGLKGPQPDASKKTAVFWGDSVIFGISKSWVEGLNDLQTTYQFLNGGIEGDTPQNILHRMLDLNGKHKIALNVFFPGWHGLNLYKRRISGGLPNQPDEIENLLTTIASAKFIPGLVLCTMPTYLSADDWATDFARLFRQTMYCDFLFTFWGGCSYTPENVKLVHDYVLDCNAMLRRVAEKYQVPLIDFYELLKFKTVEEGREFFFDVCHIRKKQYAFIEQLMIRALSAIPGVFA